MRNSFIIDRDKYEQAFAASTADTSTMFSFKVIQMLYFFIIENDDGSAEFLKNRHNGKRFMSKKEYQNFKDQYA